MSLKEKKQQKIYMQDRLLPLLPSNPPGLSLCQGAAKLNSSAYKQTRLGRHHGLTLLITETGKWKYFSVPLFYSPLLILIRQQNSINNLGIHFPGDKVLSGLNF